MYKLMGWGYMVAGGVAIVFNLLHTFMGILWTSVLASGLLIIMNVFLVFTVDNKRAKIEF
jgi:hypothetical protein